MDCYWSSVCKGCSLKAQCTSWPNRRVKRRVHEDCLDAMQKRLDNDPGKMTTRRKTTEHPSHAQGVDGLHALPDASR